VRYLAGAGDPLRDLAARIALAAPKARRDALVEAARPLVEAFAAAEEQRVVAQLRQDRSLDWTAAPSGAAPPRLTATLAANLKEPGAGDRLVLTLTVKNAGPPPAHRVAAVLRTFHPLLNGRELLVGRVGPGEERKATVEVTVPQDLRERWERVRAVVSAGEVAELGAADLTFHVREPARPAFQLHWLVDDRTTGNGDGRLGPGEAADLRVLVRNVGPGAAGEVRADAAEPRGDLAVVRARAPLGALAAGAASAGTLAVTRAKPGSKEPARPGKPGLTVTVYDKVLGADLAREIFLPVTPTAGEPFIAADEVVAPRGEKLGISAFAGPDAPVVAEATAAARLKVEARRRKWLRVALPEGRFGFVTADDVKPATGAAGATGITARYEAVPPEVKVAPHDHTVARPRFALQATVASSHGVQDAWVRVWNPEGKSRGVDKVAYVPGAEGGVRQLAVNVDVPLQEGTNYVVLDARDVNGNQGQTRLAIFQPPGVPPEVVAAPAAPEKKQEKPKSKSGCGCATGDDGGSVLVGWLLALLLIAWRRARR
jgi:carboxyl-terminal processing protease